MHRVVEVHEYFQLALQKGTADGGHGSEEFSSPAPIPDFVPCLLDGDQEWSYDTLRHEAFPFDHEAYLEFIDLDWT